MYVTQPRTVVPPNSAVLGTGEKLAVFRNGDIGREYNLEMGGSIGREAVLGGAVLGETTVLKFFKANCSRLHSGCGILS